VCHCEEERRGSEKWVGWLREGMKHCDRSDGSSSDSSHVFNFLLKTDTDESYALWNIVIIHDGFVRLEFKVSVSWLADR
jgi:hypothetical protein